MTERQAGLIHPTGSRAEAYLGLGEPLVAVRLKPTQSTPHHVRKWEGCPSA